MGKKSRKEALKSDPDPLFPGPLGAGAAWRKKKRTKKSEAGAAKNMRLLYRLLEYNYLRQLYICKKTQLIYLFYISCSFTFVVCGGKIFWWSHLKMLTKFNEIYYDWNTDDLSTDWLGWEREKNDIYRRV